MSSSGHLVLAQRLWGLGGDNLPFDVLVHVGTLLAILVVMRAWLVGLVRFVLVDAWRIGARVGIKEAWLSDPRGRMALCVVVATIPTGLIGVLWKDKFEALFSDAGKVGWALCITAALLALTLLRRLSPEDRAEAGSAPGLRADFPLWAAFVVGVMQGIAITPGISRSGSTIAVAILLGFRRPQAFDFSFLIGAPAILGALLLEAGDFAGGQGLSASVAAMSLIVAAVSGWIALCLLRGFVRRGQFGYFSLYCLAVGAWAIVKF